VPYLTRAPVRDAAASAKPGEVDPLPSHCHPLPPVEAGDGWARVLAARALLLGPISETEPYVWAAMAAADPTDLNRTQC